MFKNIRESRDLKPHSKLETCAYLTIRKLRKFDTKNTVCQKINCDGEGLVKNTGFLLGVVKCFKIDFGAGCTPLWTWKEPLNCILQMGEVMDMLISLMVIITMYAH